MNVKRSIATLLALVMLSTVFASAPVAAQDQCAVGQANDQLNVGNANIDTNVNAGNVALNIPVLSPNVGDGDQSAEANQIIQDNNDQFQSQTNFADC